MGPMKHTLHRFSLFTTVFAVSIALSLSLGLAGFIIAQGQEGNAIANAAAAAAVIEGTSSIPADVMSIDNAQGISWTYYEMVNNPGSLELRYDQTDDGYPYVAADLSFNKENMTAWIGQTGLNAPALTATLSFTPASGIAQSLFSTYFIADRSSYFTLLNAGAETTMVSQATSDNTALPLSVTSPFTAVDGQPWGLQSLIYSGGGEISQLRLVIPFSLSDPTPDGDTLAQIEASKLAIDFALE